ncbi:hypothetical protein [Dactylosporangium salmoneum]|uniref:copper amine oxidase n=1 Tax=Dactylosporangium salmoneum TaxID=53361 RepID=UPI0031CF3BE4
MSVIFDATSRWKFCWEIDHEVGLRLSDVQYTTPRGHSIPVLESAALAQIDVPYDDGQHEQVDLPGFGLLTSQLRAEDCVGGQRFSIQGFPDVLCAMVRQEPLRYEWSDYDFGSGNHSSAGECLLVYSVTPASWYTYAVKWQLCDDGSILPSVDAGGTLAPHYFGDDRNGQPVGPGQTAFAMSHYHNVFWRLQFDLDGNRIEQIDTKIVDAQHQTTSQRVDQELAEDRADNRSWRVSSTSLVNSDHHTASYDLHLASATRYFGGPAHSFTDHDVYFTEYSPCEVLASDNRHPPCAAAVDAFVSGQRLTHPVVWVQISYHHLPRDEDQPIMNQHSQGFAITPRDLTADNELVRK